MVQDLSQPLLRRMAQSRDDASPEEDRSVLALQRAITAATLRVADGLEALGLTVEGQRSQIGSGEIVFEEVSDHALCFLIDPEEVDPEETANAQARQTGVLLFDPALVDSLIEVQTISRVDGPSRAPRRPTRIDAALSQPFAQDLLAEILLSLPGDHVGARPGPLRLGTFMAGPKSLPMTLTAPIFQRTDISISLGQGVRAAQISLILPLPGQAEPGDGEEFVAHDPIWTAAMEAVVSSAPVRLDAVLPPLNLSLSRLVALKVGDTLELESGGLTALRLVSGTSGLGNPGRMRMPRALKISAKLGQLSGARAVRITGTPDDPAMEGEVAPTEGVPAADLTAPSPRASLPPAAGRGDALAAADVGMPALADGPAVGDLPALDALPDMDALLDGGAALEPLPSLDDLPPLPDLPDLP